MKPTPEYLLADFREQLIQGTKSRHTADAYYYALLDFLRENDVTDLTEITPELVEEALRERSRNGCTTLRQGILRLQDYLSDDTLMDEKAAQQIQRSKRNRSVRPAKHLYLDQTLEKINHLRNEKLRLAYRLMLASALRVSEVAALMPEDIQQLPDGQLQITVKHGKGNKYGTVTCMPDAYLEHHLPAYLKALPDGEKPFYSESYMKRQAWQLGLECHDLRRMAAQIYRQDALDRREEMDTLDVPSVPEIDEATKEFLRHERFSVTKRYLYNRKLHYHMKEGEDAAEETAE